MSTSQSVAFRQRARARLSVEQLEDRCNPGIIAPMPPFAAGPGLGSVNAVNYGVEKPNNDNAAGKQNYVSFDVTFDFANIIDIEMEVTNSLGVSEFQVELSIRNNTSVAWTTFAHALGFRTWMTPTEDLFVPSGDDDLDFDTPDKDPAPSCHYVGKFTLKSHGSDNLEWDSGDVQPGKSVLFFVMIDVPDNTKIPEPYKTLTGYKFTLRMMPNAPPPVPVPGGGGGPGPGDDGGLPLPDLDNLHFDNPGPPSSSASTGPVPATFPNLVQYSSPVAPPLLVGEEDADHPRIDRLFASLLESEEASL